MFQWRCRGTCVRLIVIVIGLTVMFASIFAFSIGDRVGDGVGLIGLTVALISFFWARLTQR